MPRMPSLTPITVSTRAMKRCLKQASSQPCRKASLRAQATAAPAHPPLEVLHRALAPQLGHAAVDRPAVVVVQAHRGGVDEAAVADRQQHRPAGERAGEHARHQHVLVLDVEHVHAFGPGQPRHLQARRTGRRAGWPAPWPAATAGPGGRLTGKAKRRTRNPSRVSDRRRPPVRRDDDHGVPARHQRPGQRLHAPLGAAGRVRREVLVDERDPHGRRCATTWNPVDSSGWRSAASRFQRARRA